MYTMVKEIEYRVAKKDSLQGHYVIARTEEQAKDIVADQKGFDVRDLKAHAWKIWDNGTATKIKQKKYWK